MLAIYLWWIEVIHLGQELIVEVGWCEHLSQIWVLIRCLIKWVHVVHRVIGVIWLPFVNTNQ